MANGWWFSQLIPRFGDEEGVAMACEFDVLIIGTGTAAYQMAAAGVVGQSRVAIAGDHTLEVAARRGGGARRWRPAACAA